MMLMRAFCLFVGLAGGMAVAQSSADIDAAIAEIASAADLLDAASSADDHVLALGQSITAFENGLRVLRDNARVASLRQNQLTAEYEAQRDDLTRLLATIYTVQSQPAPLLFLHPDGPLAAAQSAQLLEAAMPALRERSTVLGQQIAEMSQLETLRKTAAESLRDGLAGLLNARAALDDAIAKGDPVPTLFVDDRMQVQVLAATTASLGDFAREITKLPLPAIEMTEIEDAQTNLSLPVSGDVVTGFNEADAKGVSRPGLVLQAAPLSLVTTPFDATVRFAGPFLDYENVVILEPRAGTLLVVAGISRLLRAEGDVLTKGDPIGQLGGSELGTEEFLIEASTETGVQLAQTLYIELRKDGEFVDPTSLFTQE